MSSTYTVFKVRFRGVAEDHVPSAREKHELVGFTPGELRYHLIGLRSEHPSYRIFWIEAEEDNVRVIVVESGEASTHVIGTTSGRVFEMVTTRRVTKISV